MENAKVIRPAASPPPVNLLDVAQGERPPKVLFAVLVVAMRADA
jgi:hypothetical protein